MFSTDELQKQQPSDLMMGSKPESWPQKQDQPSQLLFSVNVYLKYFQLIH